MTQRSAAHDNGQEHLLDLLGGLSDEERAEAMDNLRAFLAILREWDREVSRADDNQD